jgi:hypothetical protein
MREIEKEVAEVLNSLEMTEKEKNMILKKWSNKYDFSGLLNHGKIRIPIGSMMNTYRNSTWWDNLEFRSFLSLLLVEYPHIVKQRMNEPMLDEVAIATEFDKTFGNNNLIFKCIEVKFKTIIQKVGLRKPTDVDKVANLWEERVTGNNMSKGESDFISRMKESIQGFSCKTTYSGTYIFEKLKQEYLNESPIKLCVSVRLFIEVILSVVTEYDGTEDSISAILDYMGIDSSFEEIEALVPADISLPRNERIMYAINHIL